MNENNGEIILYQPDSTIRLEVRMHEETVWLNRQQLAILFNRDIKTIGKHINNALQEELSDCSVVAKFATTARDGKTYQLGKKLFAFNKMGVTAGKIMRIANEIDG